MHSPLTPLVGLLASVSLRRPWLSVLLETRIAPNTCALQVFPRHTLAVNKHFKELKMQTFQRTGSVNGGISDTGRGQFLACLWGREFQECF